ncbi:MAG TPA: DUF6531 domain-containing protein, partial [Acidimicrobiales bacterium]|nr:DUF6531 domain-containing protein [Acidimicrobiales bacterium]
MGPVLSMRVKAMAVTATVVASSVAIVFAADAPSAGAEGKSQAYWEQFLEDEQLQNDIASRIVMTDFDPTDAAHPSAVAFSTTLETGQCNAQQRRVAAPSMTEYPLYVFDLTGEDTVKRPIFWTGSQECNTVVDLDMTPDGRTIVAQSTRISENEIDGCPGLYYNRTQIISWTRSAVGEEFGQPHLVSVADDQPEECSPEVENPMGGPEHLLGVGGDSGSSSPSISADGAVVAFTSTADNFGVGPTAASTAQALFVAGPDGDDLSMVTPASFDGVASDAEISGDGNSIVFTAVGSGLDPAVTAADGNQVFLATRDSGALTGWRYDLISGKRSDPEDAGTYGPLDGNSTAPRISEDGTRVVFTTSASDIEDGVITDDGDTDYWLVAREVSDLNAHPVRVILNPDDGTHGYPTSNGLGEPELSADGQRVAITADNDGKSRFRMFDVAMALRDDISPAPPGLRSQAAIKGAGRVIAGSAYRPLGLGGRGDKSLAALGGMPPFDRYRGSGAALYLGGGGEIGPDISKGLHGDPVDTANGAFIHHETDFTAAYAAAFMAVPRSYSSVGDQGGLFGAGWASPLDTSLDVTDELGTDVVLRLPSGRGVIYTESGGSWSTTMGYRSQLAARSGGGWEVTDPNGDVWTFDEDGLLTAWSSAAGSVEIGARSAEGVPETITADNGDVLALSDTTSVLSNGSTVNDPDGLVDRITAPHGIVVDYS